MQTGPKITITPAKFSQLGAGYIVTRKLDGESATLEAGGRTLLGELMTWRSGALWLPADHVHRGQFVAWDIVSPAGAAERRNLLAQICRESGIPIVTRFAPCDIFTVLSEGGEGLIAKPFDAPLSAPYYACKAAETFDLVITGKVETTGSIELSTTAGEPRGKCPAKAHFESLKIGDIVEIGAVGLTASGKLREPRFLRVRADKRTPI